MPKQPKRGRPTVSSKKRLSNRIAVNLDAETTRAIREWDAPTDLSDSKIVRKMIIQVLNEGH